MRCPTLSELPPPPPGKTGWPWTEESPQLPDTMPAPSIGSLRPCSGQAGQVAPWPRVSIVTPLCNQRQFIEETIRSVLLQGYPDLEYIIMDGGSTDGSVDIIRKYEKWLAYWVSEPDSGYADALNKGFERATGGIFAWINSSDLYAPYALTHVCKCFLDPSVGMIFGNDASINEEGRVLQQVKIRVRNLRRAMLYGRWTPLQDACFWRGEIHRRVGGLNFGLCYAGDFDLFLRMSFVTKCLYVDETFSFFRIHNSQLSSHGSSYRQERNEAWSLQVRSLAMPWYQMAVGLAVYLPLTRYQRAGWHGVFSCPTLESVKLFITPCEWAYKPERKDALLGEQSEVVTNMFSNIAPSLARRSR